MTETFVCNIIWSSLPEFSRLKDNKKFSICKLKIELLNLIFNFLNNNQCFP